MSWNIVLNKFVEIKNRFIQHFGINKLWEYTSGTCLEYWIKMLEDGELVKLIEPLKLNEFNNMLLIRYGIVLDDCEENGVKKTFWELYGGFYMECRSIVIDIVKDRIVLCPFRKFNNLGAYEETSIENVKRRIAEAKCIEFSNKLDGSMQSARWYDGLLVMSGSMSLNPESSFRLEDGYRMIERQSNYMNFIKEYDGYTAIFEYISPKDPHVVKYADNMQGMYLIGVRNVDTGEELCYRDVIKIAKDYNLLTTETFDTDLNQVLSSLDSKKSSEAEGFVLNIDGFKVKIKYNDFVQIHGILSKMSSPNTIIQSIAEDTFDDLISKVPREYRDKIMDTAGIVNKYIKLMMSDISDWYSTLNGFRLETRKDTMSWIDTNVPKTYIPYVKNKYLGREVVLLKKRENQYRTMKEIMDFMEKYHPDDIKK